MVFDRARADFENLAMARRELSNSTPKSRAESRSKIARKMASKFLDFFIENVAWIGSGFKTFID